jgi:Vanadium chloroperoxidase N-terminal domain/PAP2 superfamily
LRKKLATTVVLVAALFMTTFSVVSGERPAKAAPAGYWDVEDYGPPKDPKADNAILFWNEMLLEAIRKHPAQTGPTVVARALGILHTATYDAWAAYDPVAKGTRLGSSLRRKNPAERTVENKSKAISFAAYRVLTDLFPPGDPPLHPNIGPGKVDFRQAMINRGYNPDDPTTDTSTPTGIGKAVADALLSYRHSDGSNQLGDKATGTPNPLKRYSDWTGYTPENDWNRVDEEDVWYWQPLCTLTAAGVMANKPPPPPEDGNCDAATRPESPPHYATQRALTPQWQHVKPFALMSPFQYPVPGPPKIPGTSNYSTAEIQTAVNDSAGLETDVTKKVKAEYWADGPGSVFPPGHDFLFAQALSRKRRHTLDTDVKFFFILGNAMMDASIAAWAQKYKYDYVRPITAIRYHPSFRTKKVRSWLGPNKGFGTVDGSQWMPYQALHVVTPPFPEYVSGHSTFSGAGATVLAAFTGGDTFNAYTDIPAGWSTFENNVPPQPIQLTWATFSHAADEAGWSRRWGGIHFQSGDYHGRGLGRSVAQQVWGRAQAYIQGRTSG